MGIKVYIYGLLDENDDIFYIGKTSCPTNRLAYHKNNYSNPNLKVKILDYFIDKEIEWIDKFIKEGKALINKEFLKHTEEWEVGDIISTNPSYNKGIKIIDSLTGDTYNSLYKLSQHLGIDWSALKYRIQSPDKYPEFKRYKIK